MLDHSGGLLSRLSRCSLPLIWSTAGSLASVASVAPGLVDVGEACSRVELLEDDQGERLEYHGCLGSRRFADIQSVAVGREQGDGDAVDLRSATGSSPVPVVSPGVKPAARTRTPTFRSEPTIHDAVVGVRSRTIAPFRVGVSPAPRSP